MSWRIEIKRPGSEVEKIDLSTGTYTIGRSDCFINIEDTKVSRIHCTIYIHGVQAIIVDNNSSNGTFVNGTKIGTKELMHLDNIMIGMTKLKVVKVNDNP